MKAYARFGNAGREPALKVILTNERSSLAWGEDPMAHGSFKTYSYFMKNTKYTQSQNQKTVTAPRPAPTALSRNEISFVPAPDEVARRAYFSYENTGSLPGHEVQHWLTAEADLIAERNQTRTHGFHDQR